MANEFDKIGLSKKDQVIVRLLEQILDELKGIREEQSGTRLLPG